MKEQIINAILLPFLELKNPNWGDIYNAVNKSIATINKLEADEKLKIGNFREVSKKGNEDPKVSKEPKS